MNENEKFEIEETKEEAEISPKADAVEETTEETATEVSVFAEEPQNADQDSATLADLPAESEPKEVYAFRWSYADQYVHDKSEDAAAKESPRKSGGIAVFITIMIIAFSFAIAVLFLSLDFNDMSAWFAGDPDQALSVSEIVEKGMPSSVSIYTKKGTGRSSIGSGFVINKHGYVITNYHVVENSLAITVKGSNGKRYSAELIGYNEDVDIAVLYVENCDLPAVTLGDSNELELGEKVVAIGTPSSEELAFSVTSGDISGLNRSVSSKKIGMIQTNAPLNPGNSGGPLFDSRGNLVGVVTLKYTFTSVVEDGQNLPYDGIAFALPISGVIGYIEEIIRNDLDTVKVGITGVSVEEGKDYYFIANDGVIYTIITENGETYYYDMNGVKTVINEETETDSRNKLISADKTGILLVEVVKGLGAYGKLQVGDIIVSANGTAVSSIYDFSTVITSLNPGDRLKVTFYRNGTQKTETVTLMTKRDYLESTN